jgi:hypothetical protein
MRGKRVTTTLLALSAAALISATLVDAPVARAAVGVERISRSAGAPGDPVVITLGCGFCFPPCKGPKGHRHPAGFDHGPCMLGTKAEPPASFGISLVPVANISKPIGCGPGSACPPTALGPPRRHPFTFLGLATPPPGGNNPEHGGAPRYLLEFDIPHLQPGLYAYVIYCGVCARGKDGSLLAFPESARWRLRVRGGGS